MTTPYSTVFITQGKETKLTVCSGSLLGTQCRKQDVSSGKRKCLLFFHVFISVLLLPAHVTFTIKFFFSILASNKSILIVSRNR